MDPLPSPEIRLIETHGYNILHLTEYSKFDLHFNNWTSYTNSSLV